MMRPLLLSGLLASVLIACEPGNSLDAFSGRELQVIVHDFTSSGSVSFRAELIVRKPEAGCLRLHPGVEATLHGAPLQVFPGSSGPNPDGYCGDPEAPPTFIGQVDVDLFLGERQNAIFEIRDGDDRIRAEYLNFFARHTLAQVDPPLTVKPGEEVFLAWDPPTDDLSVIDKITINDRNIPARPEAGGLRVTLPADLPAGAVHVVVRSSEVTAVRCEGVLSCTTSVTPLYDRGTRLIVEP